MVGPTHLEIKKSGEKERISAPLTGCVRASSKFKKLVGLASYPPSPLCPWPLPPFQNTKNPCQDGSSAGDLKEILLK